MRYFLLSSFIVCFFLIGIAQDPTNEMLREKFAFEIIHIDEFMERFNFEQSNKLIQYLESEDKGGMQIDRKFILEKMIHLENPSEKGFLVNEFIKFVDDSVSPCYLSFYDDNWYAELQCSFSFENQEIPVILILATHHQADSASKWVIQSVISESLAIPESENPNTILSPVSQNTDFAGLHNSLKDKNNLLNYFSNDFDPDLLTYFFSLLHFEKIKLKEISKVSYHFLQVPKWIFTVNYYNVKNLQSGWLISDLKRVSSEEKEEIKKTILHL